VSFSDRLLYVVRLFVKFYIFDFSRTTGLILTRLGTNYPQGKEILNSSNEGEHPSPGGDSSKRIKIHWTSLKLFSRTSKPNSIKLGINYPWVKGILTSSNKGPGSLQSGNNYKNEVGSFKNLLMNHWARRAQIYMKPFWHNVDSSLFKSWSPGDREGPL
jgi:hypothetical protein